MSNKILVVDDDDALREMVGLVLNAAGYDTVFAADGINAVEVFKKEDPDLVLLDIMLPGQSGIEVCKQLRVLSGTPIVMLTAYTARQAQLLDAHCDLLLVGDSLGQVIYGLPSSLQVTLEMMIAHHEGAISQSETVKTEGSNADVLALADSLGLSSDALAAFIQQLNDVQNAVPAATDPNRLPDVGRMTPGVPISKHGNGRRVEVNVYPQTTDPTAIALGVANRLARIV